MELKFFFPSIVIKCWLVFCGKIYIKKRSFFLSFSLKKKCKRPFEIHFVNVVRNSFGLSSVNNFMEKCKCSKCCCKCVLLTTQENRWTSWQVMFALKIANQNNYKHETVQHKIGSWFIWKSRSILILKQKFTIICQLRKGIWKMANTSMSVFFFPSLVVVVWCLLKSGSISYG